MTEKLTLSLMEDAHDFILSAAGYARKKDRMSWKYAVLNLACGLELILKARLEKEHWSLIFANVNKAAKEKIKQGDFVSVDMETAIDRLKNISEVSLSLKTQNDLKAIRKIRNKIMHFAVNVNVRELRALVAKGINIFIEFYKENFEFEADDSFIYDLSQALVEFDEFVSSRLEALKDVLETENRPTIRQECSQCLQDALVINDDIVKCLFCGHESSKRELAESVAESPVEVCPECGEETFVLVLYNNEEGDWICISCGFKSSCNHNSECERCGRVFWSETDEPICENCWSQIMEKD